MPCPILRCRGWSALFAALKCHELEIWRPTCTLAAILGGLAPGAKHRGEMFPTPFRIGGMCLPGTITRTRRDSSLLQIRSLMGTRSVKLDVAVANGRKALFALVSIGRGEILIDLNGEDASPSPTKRSLQMAKGKHVVGREGTVGYLNHGCEPNTFLDFTCLCVRALKDIPAGEEVRINHSATEYEMHDSFRCECGSPVCLRTIAGFRFLTRDQLRLKPYLAPYLLGSLE